jgi:threonyl-tRNA synthetase
MNKQIEHYNLRHSAQHILAKAVEILYPEVKKVIGPPIENGFYFDFDLEHSINPEEFEKIEELMKKIVKANLPIKGREVSEKEAKEIFADNQYKLDTINKLVKKGESLSVYEIGTPEDEYYDMDLCAGRHVKYTKKVKAFKLLSVAGAYYEGDENKKMLQRIYGTAFPSKQELNEYLEERQRRLDNDHRKVNNYMDIFVTSDLVGKGLVMYTPNGSF